MRKLQTATIALLSSIFAFVAAPAVGQSGHVLNGVGPIDQGMAGAGMAAPQDASTALHWNPASAVVLDGRRLDIGLQFMQPTGEISSSVALGAFGQVPNAQGGMTPFPWQPVSGKTESQAGPFPIPSIGFLVHRAESRFAFGLSAFGVGGFGVDYALSPADLMTGSLPDNPILSPQQAERGMGFGALSSTFMLLQISPTVAYRVSDAISVGIAPTLNVASLELSVFPATSPQMFVSPMDPTGQTMLALYPDAPAAWSTGFGFQAGIHAVVPRGLSVGVSYKSPQRFSRFEFDPTTAGAAPYSFRLDYPMVLSGAVAWSGMSRLLLAADVRYIDFAHTTGFDSFGFGPTGEVQGFGWQSITVVAVGAQYEIASGLPIRVGYSFNGNPVHGHDAFFNTPAPAIVTQHVSGGASYRITETVRASLAVQYGLSNEVEGTWMTIDPSDGTTVGITGTQVRNRLSTLTVIGGVSVRL